MSENAVMLRDPVHGYIKVYDYELDIINTPAFQRLRNIKQLALTYLVYHGAEHSRFGHSLGVMHLATKVYDALLEKHRHDILKKWTDIEVTRNRMLLRLVALLHDVGHPPFSHAGESVFTGTDGHEEYTRRIIDELLRPTIENRYSKFGIKTNDVIDFFVRGLGVEAPFIKEIFSGELDVDRMDYLLRDSLMCGVQYGQYDLERLIHTLCIVKDEQTGTVRLAVEEGGIHSLEALILARYFMFTQVYFYHARRIYDLHLARFLETSDIKPPADITDYIAWDDIRLMSFMRDRKGDNDHARRILDRDSYVYAFQTPEHCSPEQRERFNVLKSEVTHRFSDAGEIIFDAAEKEPHKFQRTDFPVVLRNRASVVPVTRQSGIIARLESIRMYRIYVAREHRSAVGDFASRFWDE
ncbi:MAG: HD domain-containing protein [Candidatus Auribacter fodinae]|uniref:HD domain-containing protein n=1 Tax=Candidatus Auribacter fodinae TaxID=2093366 RepID=A0A3A4QX20_9BACT|nr:MAG: HD domain-containing protein [Candidatus Auribacter fodinae]